MKTLLVSALFVTLLSGCAAKAPWWTAMETATNTKCLDFVKHMTCPEFLAANERIRPGLVQAVSLADLQPLPELNGKSEAWLFQQMLSDIDRDRVILKDTPECWERP